jgi:NOL1/NOP2/sun family putative RNA methylase
MKYQMKPLFEERMKKLLLNNEDFNLFSDIVHKPPRNFIRCNTLKLPPDQLLERLRKRWNVSQPYPDFPEIMLIENDLLPGELGNSIEHLLGYYYIQEVSSMLSVIALDPKPNEFVLDLCASPGSKTTQIATKMQNSGTLIANDLKLDRIVILASNLEKAGVSNAIVTKNDSIDLCSRFQKNNIKFDKILLDAPCSGEGTLRSSPKTFQMWNHKVVEKLSRQQKKMIAHAIKCLNKNGVLVYSTCTHSPEENEFVIDFALKNFPVKVEQINLPLKSRPGLKEWNSESFNPEVAKACRIYPQDNDSEGFFLCKLILLEDLK